jgi:hypothetical protein
VLAGTGLRLDLFATVWPWVLALGVLRAFGFHYGLVWAARDVGTSPQLARNGWVGIMGQGGVAIGLASLARRAFPEWGVSLEAFVLGMIGVHEIIGPVLWRWALRQTGPGREREGERSAASNPATRLAVVSGSGVQ